MSKIDFYKTTLLLLFFISIFQNKAFAQYSNSPYLVNLKTEQVLLSENIKTQDWTTDVETAEVINGKVYRLLQFYEMPTTEQKRNIKAAGIELLDYIPNRAYVAALPKNLETAELEALQVRSISKIKSAWKQSEEVRYQNFGGWAMQRNTVNLSVRFHKNLKWESIVTKMDNAGIRVTKTSDFMHLIHVNVPLSKVAMIAELPFVSYVSQITDPGVPEDDLGRALHRSNLVDSDSPMGRHYDGEGVNILVRDDGSVGPHIDYQGRLNQNTNDMGGGTHGDGVGGVASGAGNLNPKFRGAARGAQVYVRDYIADFLDETLALHLIDSVMITNSSYSNGCNAGYTDITETVDLQIFENPTLMHVFSGGNSNNQECDYGAGDQWANITGGHKQGKNVIATANIFANGNLVNSSSRGPAHDGRIKPDIAANGQNQMSTDPDNTYAPFGGTSGAAPCVMGTMAQLYQAYKELNGGENPESSLIKAAMLNTANDLGNEGPDYKTGWGHLNAHRAVKLLEDERYLDGTITQGEMTEHTLDIPAGTKQVRFMVYWMDLPATPMAGPALVNDLNLMVTDPTANTLLPWVLDPTPDAVTLDLPAGNGVDNLNNVEQVLINNPNAGTYTLMINGATIPADAVKYYVLYEVIGSDDITVVYPNGDEGFVPAEEERIHWDAIGNEGSFLVEYSVDNGTTWTNISNVNGDQRMFDWTVPEALTGEVQVRVSRDGVSDTSDFNFSIGGVPSGVEVVQACPDYVRLVWNEMDSVTAYDVFQLGEKFMDSIGTTSDLFFDVPITDPTEENWFAVRAVGTNDFVGRRSIAINHDAGLLSCMVSVDAANNEILSPLTANILYTCEEAEQTVSLSFQNNGVDSLQSVNLYYQLDNETPVMETYATAVAPFADVMFTFATPISIATTGTYVLRTWIELSGDEASYNDSQEISFTVVVGSTPSQPDVVENFEGAVFPPADWLVINGDESQTWEEVEVTGSDGNTTVATAVLNFSYNVELEEDELVSLPIDLTAAINPFLTFDLAYTPYSDNYTDSMRVDIFTDCGSQYHSTVFGASHLELATIPAAVDNFWAPESADDWENNIINLSELVGETIVVKFINVSSYGNNLYLDNINVLNTSSAAPEAMLTTTANEICVQEEVTFENNSSGFNNSYDWDFGDGANLGTASGNGPFVVSYSTAGMKTITLTATNDNGSDMTTQQVMVDAAPQPSFTYTLANGEIILENTSVDVEAYTWDMGDGTILTEENPTYTYPTSGLFTVTLTGRSGVCDEVTVTEMINVIVLGIKTQDLLVDAQILPNPNAGSFDLKITDPANRTFEVALLDVRGRILEEKIVAANATSTLQRMGRTDLAAGIYFVKIKNDAEVKMIKVAVQ